MKNFVWRYAPVYLLKLLCLITGSFRAKEKLGLLRKPWYAYGLLSAADLAHKQGFKQIWAFEFGVASGRGLRNLKKLSQEVARETGVKIKIAGFDTGTGMPFSMDYRDHPEKYHEGDYPMMDVDALRRDLGGDVELVIGDIADTISEFRKKLSKDCPVGFFAIDLDVYSSTKSAFKLFDGDPELYLPMTFAYFDDSSSRSHFNRFAGELLAIDEFNEEHEIRKIDIDRGVWNSHRRLEPQHWYERMYILHLFDHPARFEKVKRAAKIISEQ